MVAVSTDMMRPPMDHDRIALNRRHFFEVLSAMGLAGTVLPDALVIAAQDATTVTVEMIAAAQAVAGVAFTREEREAIVERLNADRGYLDGAAFLRAANLGNAAQPAIVFNPVPPGKVLPTRSRGVRRQVPTVTKPHTDEALAFLPVTQLAALLQSRQVTSSELTEIYLARLARYNPQLRCVVSLTPDLARAQAREADAEIAAGRYRGPLHGVPFGLKDLFAVRGTKTTWGASPYQDQVVDVDATVYTRLRAAGAVLVAKLSTGALALSAQWFGGTTRSPWNTAQDAAGSSAGPGAATAAGLVAFSIGSDTGGSIMQPSARNGLTGLRPTFGHVSRHGAMTLAWTQDTVGPMCRSAEDCALVFDAIYGPDGKDNSVLDVPVGWDAGADVTRLRVGYLRSAVGEAPTGQTGVTPAEAATRRNTAASLQVIRDLGAEVRPFDLPEFALEAIDFIRYAETAAAFDQPTRDGTIGAVENGPEQSRRPAEIRPARFIPAVDYIQANRYRLRVMEQLDAAMADFDLFVGANLLLTNRTGHPALSLPNGFFEGSPTALQMTGKLFGEPELLMLAHAYQTRTDHHVKRPPI
jgi:Asp-tRNA(Asn)/Glu-tRNA(Gln) amidotransferase A subunit family amidase